MATTSDNLAPDKDAEATSGDYAKGLPKRGALKVAVAASLIALVAVFFLIPDGNSQKPKVAQEPVTRPQADSSKAVASELKSAVPAAGQSPTSTSPTPRFNPATPPPLSSERSSGSANSRYSSADSSDMPLTKEELARVRREKAAASTMEVPEFDLRTNRENAPQASAQERAALQGASISAQADDATNKAMSRYLEANRQPAAPLIEVRRPSSDEQFLTQTGANGVGTLVRSLDGPEELVIAQGTIVRLALMRGINTDSPGQITAQVVSNVYDSRSGRILLIPKGSRVIGIYNSEFGIGQRRIVMAMTRLDLPNGVRINLSGSSAADIQGYSGLEADVDNHYFSIFGSSLLVGAASLLLPKDQQSITTTATAAGSVTSGGIFGRAVNSVAEILAARNRIIKPTGRVEPGDAFSFSTTKEIVMEEYK